MFYDQLSGTYVPSAHDQPYGAYGAHFGSKAITSPLESTQLPVEESLPEISLYSTSPETATQELAGYLSKTASVENPIGVNGHPNPTAEEVFGVQGINPSVEPHAIPTQETQGWMDQLQQFAHEATNGHEVAAAIIALGVIGAGAYYLSKDR